MTSSGGGTDSSRRGRRLRRSHLNSGLSIPLVRRFNRQGENLFRQHGRWITKHQIRTLLLCSLVITSLFYPAVGIYFWASKGGPGVAKGDAKSVWRSLSTPFMDSFASSGRKHVNGLSDLRMIWDDARDLRAMDVRDTEAIYGDHWDQDTIPKTSSDRTASRPRCQSIRVEHVFVTTEDVMAGQGPRFGVLEKRILQSALQLQNLISTQILDDLDTDASILSPCIRARTSFPGRDSQISGKQAEQSCLVLSPLEYWQLDAESVLADDDPARTVAQSLRNRTKMGAPLSVPTTLAGRWHLFKRLPRAEYLAFTFFLLDRDNFACLTRRQRNALPPAIRPHDDQISSSHAAWLDMLDGLTGGQVGLIPSQQNISHELVLQFSPQRSSSKRNSSHLLLFAAYLLVLVYISRGLVKLRKVHSRFGLAFTGTTQLIISMIMSVSICALLGIRLTLVPWELLPFVIVVVGTENMFSLTKAIIDTPISLPVSSRIAHGLSKVGVSITLTTLADVLLLSVIAIFIGVRAVREFCIFAIFSLMMDWFLQMTFFVTVLSIDMQRLELADLLTQGTRQRRKEEDVSSQKEAEDRTHRNGKKPIKPRNALFSLLRAMWRARSARTASLTLILVYMSGLYLYYGTGFPSQQQEAFVLAEDWNVPRTVSSSSSSFDPFAHLDDAQPPLPWWTSSPSADLWNSLNPFGARELKITVEPWTILSLKSLSKTPTPPSPRSFAGWALFRPRIRAVIWFAKLVVLPISGTTALLWMLLLYLLKDTELLDAQRDKSEADPLDEDQSHPGITNSQSNCRVTLLAQAHRSDIEFVAEKEGLVVSIDVDKRLQLWRLNANRDAAETIGPVVSLTDIRSGPEADTSSVTSLALSGLDGFICVGFASGRVCFITTKDLHLIWDSMPQDAAAPVARLTLLHREAMHSMDAAIAISCHRDGSAFVWNCARKSVEQYIFTSSAAPQGTWRIFPVEEAGESQAIDRDSTVHLGFSSSDGQFEIRSLKKDGKAMNTIFRLSVEHAAHVRSAMLLNGAVRSPIKEEPSNTTSVMLGFSNGTLGHFSLGLGRMLSSLDLEDGAVSKIHAPIEKDDSNIATLAVETATRISLVMLSNSGFGSSAVDASGSVNGSLSAFAGGSPIRIRTPNGSRANAASFWADGSTPPSPASELASPMSYPVSSHGSASRLRRASAHTKDRSSATASEGMPLSSSGTPLLTVASLPPPVIRMDDPQLRLLGWIRVHRGGCHVARHGSLLIGVSRAKRSEVPIKRYGSPMAGAQNSSRWETWTLNLRDELIMGRGGELLVPRQPMQLDVDDATSFDPSSQTTGSLPARVRFAGSSSTSSQALAFTRLHPICGLSHPDGKGISLLFGFGVSIGIVQHREE